MIHIVCHSCHLALRISGDYQEVEHLLVKNNTWYPDHYPCVKPECPGQAVLEDSIEPLAASVLDVHDLTVAEAFVALSGLGLPAEQECGPLAVNSAFSTPVKKTNTRFIKGSNRTVLDSIEFVDGTILYLGSSPYGAIVYRISGRRSITDEVLSEV